MKIIDRNTDFYDYCQNMYPDDTFTFDRSDSYLLTKDIVCEYIYLHRRGGPDKLLQDKPIYKFGLLQIGSTFWLLLFNILQTNNFNRATDYEVELVTSWKNYDKQRELIKFSIVDFELLTHQLRLNGSGLGYFFEDLDRNAIFDKSDALVQAININDYKSRSIDSHTVWKDQTPMKRHIPILKASGLSQILDPFEVYSAFDEYFSLEKQSSERIDAEGTTNNDKIVNHGFDTKVSFRGKTNN